MSAKSLLTALFLSVFLVAATQVSSANSPSKIGMAARSLKNKHVKSLEQIVKSAKKKKAWFEAVEVLGMVVNLDPDNPFAATIRDEIRGAFLAAALAEKDSDELKAVRQSRDAYLQSLGANLWKAQKAKDALGVLECSTLLLKPAPDDPKLRAIQATARKSVAKIDPEKVAVSPIQKAARDMRIKYLENLTAVMHKAAGADDSAPSLVSAQYILEVDPKNNAAKKTQEDGIGALLKETRAKQGAKRKRRPFLRRAQTVLSRYVKTLEQLLAGAKNKRDFLGVLECTKLILQAQPNHKLAKELQDDARENLVKLGEALGRPLTENDLEWYKSTGQYSFDGGGVVFNSGTLGVGPMALNVIITCRIKANRPHLKYGWGVQKSTDSPVASDKRLDGTQWVKFAVVATPHVGFWWVEGTVYRPDGCPFRGRLIIYPRGGPVELKDVRVYQLK